MFVSTVCTVKWVVLKGPINFHKLSNSQSMNLRGAVRSDCLCGPVLVSKKEHIFFLLNNIFNNLTNDINSFTYVLL